MNQGILAVISHQSAGRAGQSVGRSGGPDTFDGRQPDRQWLPLAWANSVGRAPVIGRVFARLSTTFCCRGLCVCGEGNAARGWVVIE